MESVDMIVEMPNLCPRRAASVDLPVPEVPQIMMITPLSLCSRLSASFSVGWNERACTSVPTTCIKSSLQHRFAETINDFEILLNLASGAHEATIARCQENRAKMLHLQGAND